MAGAGSRILSLAFDTGARRRLEGWSDLAIKALAAGTTVWVVYAAMASRLGVLVLTIIFLALMLALTFLTVAPGSKPTNRLGVVDGIMALLSLGCGAWFLAYADDIEQRIALLSELSQGDLIVGTLTVLLTLEAMRRTVGAGLTVIVLAFIAYNLFGDLLPGALGHGEITGVHFLDITIFTTDGLFGVPLRVAGTYVFLFVLFGTLLSKIGGSEFFYNLAAALTGRQPGGPAKIAVISSGMYGTISGSPTSDVVTTGSITIPMMVRTGYRPTMAAAVEVSASTGGSLLPPVMGSAAFIMAEYTGIPYAEIAIAAVIPALLYYLVVYLQVDFRARRRGLRAIEGDIPRLADTMRAGLIFVVPLVVISWALLNGYTATFSALYGIAATLAVALLRAVVRKANLADPVRAAKEGLALLFDILAESAFRVVAVAGACAAAGLVIGGITMTGLAGKFGSLVFLLSGDNPAASLVLAGLLTIILGLGMPTPSAYILAAVLVGPVLDDLGFSTMAAHMFLFYFAVMSALTPPVAVAAYAAAAIADANPLPIATQAVKLAAGAFLLPFAFVYHEALLMQGGWAAIVLTCLAAVIAVTALAAAVEGYLVRSLAGWERRLLLLAAISLMTLNPWGVALAAVSGGLVAVTILARRAAPG